MVIRAGIVGATGYTGVELLRLLILHPKVDVVVMTSRSQAGRKVADFFPSLRGQVDLVFTDPEQARLSDCDVVFFATPHGTAMRQVPDLLVQGVKVIDLSADFRLRDPALWTRWYGMPHACPELLEEAVYGLPEFQREAIRKARLVANPGCYPTAVLLGFLPLVEHGLVDTNRLIADAKSGVSGAGRRAQVPMLFGEVSENFKAYGVAGHRHLPEIRQALAARVGAPLGLTFVPHLVPMIRGIHATLYAWSFSSIEVLQEAFKACYALEPFVDVLPLGSHPETKATRGANVCRLAVHKLSESDQVVVLSVIDNLIKGAAGQAVQNMNLMFNLDETAGLATVPLIP